MPRVSTKKKNKAGEAYGCCRCADPIKAGDQYYEWSFRYGGTHRQHISHGSPKQSQLTQSKMSGAYAAIESAEEAIAAADNVEDIKSALEECATEIESVAEEYQESFDNIPENLQQGGPAQEMQEKIEGLQSFAEELNSAASDLEDFDEEEPVREGCNTDEEFEREQSEWQGKFDDHLEQQRTAADEALGNLSI
jgi:DNA repair ATPase RecN